ncbi:MULTISPECIES: major capsid protein [unclassified Streptomyces]|uniref:major capsid protein n=1 Tax=unclassified Streptomyces TaxID=2593676 RepID=UPI002DD8FA7B|nr:major capsid protein [Streptomyces sp. NBC_01763]WSC35555.1 major capsid protein [Streptomyces sp. NBC_01763]WSF88245.1 major capsid protein [Streptomyces sp. NBC_01744]
MAEFELPEDIRSLNDDELAETLDQARAAFAQLSAENTIDDQGMTRMRALATGVQDIRQEQANRLQAAQRAATEIEALAAQVRGDDPAAEPVEETPAEPTAAADPEPEPVVEAPVQTATATASLVARPALNLSSVRRHQPRVLPEPPAPTTSVTAAVDVPGYTPGSPLGFGEITAGIISRANALKTAGGGVGQVISYRHPYPEDLIVTDSSSAPEGTNVALRASDQNRLPQGNLVASGGWCAPSETVYELTSVSCPDMLWDAPEIQLARGGLRYYKTPSLDVAAMTWLHTEADDISGATKPCFRIPCPDPVEVRCDAVGVCLEAGILTQRHFPELVSWYLRNSMVAHEIRLRQVLFAQAIASATPVTLPATFGALSPVFAAVALQAADMIERHSFCDSISLEVVFPWWSRNLFLADLARRNGVSISEVTEAQVQALFTPLGVRIQWARGLSPAVPTNIGATTPATAWPDEIQFLIYPAGQLQIGRGEEVNLGVIHDSSKFSTNDYTALFSEECVSLVDRSVDTRVVTVPVCPTGETGAQTLMTCPAA